MPEEAYSKKMDFLKLSGLLNLWNGLIPLLQIGLIFAVVFFVSNFILGIIKKRLLKRATTSRQVLMIGFFTRIARYVIVFLLTILVISTAFNTLKEFGITVSIFSAAIGFALQKPITGVAAWFMVMVRKPFEVGDRITIGDVKGNVKEISFTHVYLEEVGRYGGEEVSGRTVIIANNKLFEENIINYTFTSEFILGQVIFTITFESDLNKAIDIAMTAAEFHTKEFNKKAHKDVHARITFTQNGMEIHARYFVPFMKAQEIATYITRDIYNGIRTRSDVELSYQQHKFVTPSIEDSPFPKSK